MDQTGLGHTQPQQNDTIDLRELFAILKKRKKLIYILTSLITTLSIAYAFLIAKPVYAVKFMIEAGQINNKPVEDINTIKEKLSFLYKVNAKGVERKLPLLTTIAAKKNSLILSFTVLGKSNDEAETYAQTLINEIEAQQKEQTDDYIDSQKNLIKLTQNTIKEANSGIVTITKELADYRQKIVSLKSTDASLTGIYVLRIGQLQTKLQALRDHISELKNKEQTLKLSITSVNVMPTHRIGTIKTLKNPIEPKKKLIIIVNFISGLMVSVFLAFFLEFITNMRSKEDETTSRN